LAAEARNSQVFINCPFSKDYKPLFEAIVFAVADCGFKPRCALEADDAGEVRFAKIIRIIKSCAYGVHDLSFMELDPNTKLARLNMSFELGLFLGARHFGSRKIRDKTRSFSTPSRIVIKKRFRISQGKIFELMGTVLRGQLRMYAIGFRRLIQIRPCLEAPLSPIAMGRSAHNYPNFAKRYA
jgi:hypothetical protein